MPSKVGIIGSGAVSKALAKGFSQVGYELKVGSRSPEKLEWVGQLGAKASTGTFDEAASFGEIVVLAVLGEVTEKAIDLCKPGNFVGKLVLDATNPLDFSKGRPPGLLPEFKNSSLGELVQKKLPESMVVKCFNTVPNSQFFQPKYKDAYMLICGNDESAKKTTTGILKQFGWAGSIDVGGIESARYTESLVPLWARAAMAVQSFDSMFVLVK
jgi:8-hydroxy-5-deazaflavin:NADPH oxidoreductase